MLMLFQQPLGLPDWVVVPALIVTAVSALAIRWLQRRRSRKNPSAGTSLVAQGRPPAALLLALVAATTLSTPFWLPYTGSRLPFRQLIVVAIVSCLFGVGAVLLGLRRRKR
jgi:predicted signal transduction protein with EAL and GGDEF domain